MVILLGAAVRHELILAFIFVKELFCQCLPQCVGIFQVL